MIALYQSHTYSAPSGPNFTSTGRKLLLVDVISGCGRSSRRKPAPSSLTVTAQTALFRYPPRISAPCHDLGKWFVPTMSPPLHLRPRPSRQISVGGASRRLGTSPGTG